MIRHALTELSPEEYERLHKFFPGPNQGTMATRNPLWTPSRGPVDGRLIAGDAFGAPSHPEVLHPEQCRESNYRAKHSTVESARVGEPQGRFRTAARLGHKRNVPLPGRDDPRQRLGMPGTCRRVLIRRAMSLPILVGFWLCRSPRSGQSSVVQRSEANNSTIWLPTGLVVAEFSCSAPQRDGKLPSTDRESGECRLIRKLVFTSTPRKVRRSRHGADHDKRRFARPGSGQPRVRISRTSLAGRVRLRLHSHSNDGTPNPGSKGRTRQHGCRD